MRQSARSFTRPRVRKHLALVLLTMCGTAAWACDSNHSPVGATTAHAATRVALRNPFGQGMFGIAGDGSLQDEGPAAQERDLAADARAGARWLRVDINWAQIQQFGPRQYNWTAIDSLVTRAEARGLHVLGVLIYTPLWAEARRSCLLGNCAPKPGAFATFARTAVAHYAALGVQAYEVWSEENSTAEWLPKPSPAAYTQLLKDSYPGMKRADPSATIITGGTSPALSDGTNYSPVDWLAALYRHGAKRYFDAVGAHPYAFPAYPGQKEWWSSWYQMFGASRSMRSVMIAHGDRQKRIWGTEFGAATFGLPNTYVSLKAQAKMVFDAYRLWSTYRWAGPLFVYEGRDEDAYASKGTMWGYLGLLYNNFRPKPSFTSYRRAASLY